MSSGPEKGLIAAEEPSRRSDLRRTLEVLGFDVGEASGTEVLMARLRMVDYEAILLDVPVYRVHLSIQFYTLSLHHLYIL